MTRKIGSESLIRAANMAHVVHLDMIDSQNFDGRKGNAQC